MIKLTEKSIEKLKAPDPSRKQVLHWDDSLRGFAVLCSGVSTAKTYVVQRAVNGRTRRVTVAPCNVLPLAEARKKAETVLGQFYQGIDPKLGRRDAVTLREALEQYLTANKKLSSQSQRFYRGVVERYLADWLDLPLRTITPEMVEARHRKIQQLVAKGNNKGHAMANSTMVSFRIIWNYAAEGSPSLPPNPVSRLRRSWFKVPRRTRLVKGDDLPAFYAAVLGLENMIYRDFILMLLFTGMRKSEAAGLTWNDVDFASKVIRVPAERMKAKRAFYLPLSDFLHQLLVARRAIGRDKLVFPSNGTAVDPRLAFRHIAATTNIVVSPHDLRRTFITVAESIDISSLALKSLVAHSTGDDVTAGYAILSNERVRDAAQRVTDKMKVLCGVAPIGGTNVATLKRKSKLKS